MGNSWKAVAAMGLAMIFALHFDAIVTDAAPADTKQKTEEPAPQEWFVAQDGTGQFTTISEAVEQAAEGDIIWIYPGVYEESVQIQKGNMVFHDYREAWDAYERGGQT